MSKLVCVMLESTACVGYTAEITLLVCVRVCKKIQVEENKKMTVQCEIVLNQTKNHKSIFRW